MPRCLERLNTLLDEAIAGTHLTRRELLSSCVTATGGSVAALNVGGLNQDFAQQIFHGPTRSESTVTLNFQLKTINLLILSG